MANFLYGNIEDAIKRAKDMQKSYERNLVGKSILYLYLDNNTIKSLNVVFEEKNYLHLTGLDYNHIREGNLINGTKNPTQAINFYKLLKSDTPISQMKKNISFITLPNQSDNQNMFENTQKSLKIYRILF